MRNRVVGSAVGVASAAALGGALLPLRSHMAISTVALILVVPVVFGSVIGGVVSGSLSVIAGFVIYDVEFIPPYGTLNVGSAQNWVALGVYVAVMLLVAQVVVSLDAARSQAERANDVTRRLWELSELLVGEQPVDALLTTIVTATQSVFALPGVTLLIADDGRLRVAASAGEPLSSEELARLDPHSGVPVSVGTAGAGHDELRTVALSVSGRPVGMLAMRRLPVSVADRAVLNTFANDAALALERARLREQAMRSQVLEEVDRLRRAMMGAVSHDLRTPLATIKVASSTLAQRAASLSAEQAGELHHLIEIETDRLSRLVSNLLDMTRIETGVLVARRATTEVSAMVDDALGAMGSVLEDHHVDVQLARDLPDVDVDRLLIGQVMMNLLDNAVRHAPAGGSISVRAERRGDLVVLSVADQGPGIAAKDQDLIFDRFGQSGFGGRAGLGLTIAKTFVAAHGERIWYEDAPGGGARFAFSMPISPVRVG